MSTMPVATATDAPDTCNAVGIDVAARSVRAPSRKELSPQSLRATACRRRAIVDSPRKRAARISAAESGDFPDVARTCER